MRFSLFRATADTFSSRASQQLKAAFELPACAAAAGPTFLLLGRSFASRADKKRNMGPKKAEPTEVRLNYGHDLALSGLTLERFRNRNPFSDVRGTT